MNQEQANPATPETKSSDAAKVPTPKFNRAQVRKKLYDLKNKQNGHPSAIQTFLKNKAKITAKRKVQKESRKRNRS